MNYKTYAVRSANGVRIVTVPESLAQEQCQPGETIAPVTEQDYQDVRTARQAIREQLHTLREDANA